MFSKNYIEIGIFIDTRYVICFISNIFTILSIIVPKSDTMKFEMYI